MDIYTPIEITENSTGLDMLNEVRRAFSVYFLQQIQNVMQIPATDEQQARTLSRHLTQRLATMHMLSIIGSVEVSQATDHLYKIFHDNAEPTIMIFAPVDDVTYRQHNAIHTIVTWNAMLQYFFTQCLKKGSEQTNEDERNRLYSFAENAVYCWHDLRMMMPAELSKALEIIQAFRDGNTRVNTKYTGADIPTITYQEVYE